MHEDCSEVTGQDDIRPARQVSPVKAEPVAHGVKETSDDKLWAGVLALDGLHDASPLFGVSGVHCAVPKLSEAIWSNSAQHIALFIQSIESMGGLAAGVSDDTSREAAPELGQVLFGAQVRRRSAR